MHRILSAATLLAVSAFFTLPAASVQAQENTKDQTPFGKSLDELTPDEILSLVRFSYTLHDREFDAQLRKDFKAVKFKLSLKPNYIRFRFDDPPQAIHLDTAAERLALREIMEGINGEIGENRYGDPIRGTDVAYEDLALRFLYWPNPRVVAHETYKTRDAWKLQIINPDNRGPYGYVFIWIDKASGGLLKMEGYSRGTKPEMLKEFQVTHGKKMDDVWIADVIRIRSFQNNKREGTTWLEILNLKD
ncbi:MAG: hypothetical protein ACI8UO_002097 [Verrucomicrobiales bacterium]|jgi:hypothetical protein